MDFSILFKTHPTTPNVWKKIKNNFLAILIILAKDYFFPLKKLKILSISRSGWIWNIRNNQKVLDPTPHYEKNAFFYSQFCKNVFSWPIHKKVKLLGITLTLIVTTRILTWFWRFRDIQLSTRSNDKRFQLNHLQMFQLVLFPKNIKLLGIYITARPTTIISTQFFNQPIDFEDFEILSSLLGLMTKTINWTIFKCTNWFHTPKM